MIPGQARVGTPLQLIVPGNRGRRTTAIPQVSIGSDFVDAVSAVMPIEARAATLLEDITIFGGS